MYKKSCLITGVLSALIFLSAKGTAQDDTDLPETEVIAKTVRLARGARVEVTGIAGPVEVTTTDGDTAQVHIVRSAETRAELECYRTVIDASPTRLEIRHEQFTHRAKCESIRSRQRVKLVVPRSVELSLEQIAGYVNVGSVDGVLRLSNIAGHVSVSGAQAVEMSSLAKGLTMKVGRVSVRGMRIEGVVGRIEFQLKDNLNAELVVKDIIGNVSSETPQARVNKEGTSRFRVQIGAGGAQISLSSITGNITLRGE
jgi:hypothetical protein